MYREFFQEGKNGTRIVTHRDKIYFRLKSDRTVKIFSQKSRPFLEWRKKAPKEDEKKKKLFEAPGESNEDISKVQQLKAFRTEQEALYEADGAW